MPDVPNTRFFNFVDTPAAIEYSQFGEAFVDLEGDGGSVDLTEFRRVSVRIGSTSATSFSVSIGKIANATLAYSHVRPTNNEIHTFEVEGPELNLWLKGGPPGSNETVQLWVYLRS
jgi:hypothetical protein